MAIFSYQNLNRQQAPLVAAALLILFFFSSPGHTATIEAQVLDQKGNPVKDAVLIAKPLDKNLLPPYEPPKDEVDQIDKDFVPHVKVVTKGTPVFFPNKDDIRHHVYSFSPAKIFELPLYSGTPSEPVVFDQPGEITLGCNIHDWMLGYIYVADTPWFRKSDETGKITLEGLPVGEYTFHLWHPEMKEKEGDTAKTATLHEDKPTSLQWQLSLKPTFRIPRSSGGANSLYR